MTAAALALAYPRFAYDNKGRVANLRETLLAPVLKQAEDSIDVVKIFGCKFIEKSRLLTNCDFCCCIAPNHRNPLSCRA
ncbi:hypothetical protein AJ87_13240 [Rhizobium yanglingense]|nr:hypothetical protein AJ87_13240 [Rhizobium yanglingense]